MVKFVKQFDYFFYVHLMDLFELLYIHGGAIIFAGMATYTVIKCITCKPLVEIFTDTDDDNEHEIVNNEEQK